MKRATKPSRQQWKYITSAGYDTKTVLVHSETKDTIVLVVDGKLVTVTKEVSKR